MCGIIGMAGSFPESAAARLVHARDLMAHRGPDAAGVWSADRVRLGFRRLSILDVSEDGHQPMVAADGRTALVFNGEVYNFRELRAELARAHEFRSWSDAEVVLHGYAAWGWDELLRRLDGMYAFAIWDARTRTLRAARDRVGKKPLFYRHAGGALLFASTLNALRELLPGAPAVDPVALDAFLTYQAVPAPLTIFGGVSQLPPAHALTFSADTGTLSLSRYWDLPFAPKRPRASEAEVLDDLDALARAAVRRRLASDVPLGAFLSGGVDSSLVVAMMAAEMGAPVEAVVAGFDVGDDERPYARRVAAHCDARLHEEVLGADALDALPDIVWHHGQPLADVSIVPSYHVARVARRHVTVVLNGDGGDELFAGYARPVVARAAELYRAALPGAVRHGISRALGSAPESARGPLRKARLLAAAGAVPADAAFTYERGFRAARDVAYGPALRRALAGRAHPDALYADAWRRAVASDDTDRALYGEFATYLPDQLLAKMDVATMAHGVEGRSPLLDRALIEYAATIPTALRLRGNRTKYLLKRLAERYVPRDVLYRRKRGFVAPVAAWLRGDRYAHVLRAVLGGDAFADRGWMDPAWVRRALEEQQRGSRARDEQLWTLLVLELWARMALDGSVSRGDALSELTAGGGSGVGGRGVAARDVPGLRRPRPATPDPRPAVLPPRIHTLQLGMGYFPEQAGGLNRYVHELTAHLPAAGVSCHGLVTGSADVATHSGGRTRAFARSASALPARLLAARAAVREALRADPSRLVVSHFALYTLPASGIIGDRPMVVHFHGPWADEVRAEGAGRVSHEARRRVERAVYRRGTAFVVLSRAFARVLHERYDVPEERIRVVPGGVDVARFAPLAALPRRACREALGWPTDRPIALAVRRLARRMGLEDLIAAARDVRRRVPDALVLIAGGGRLRAELEARVRDAGLAEHVRLLGFLPDAQLPLAYRAADVTVVPTVALEGFGLIVAESLAA
ncbi:MAG TPA: asparagine synthase (glutamine-hydrolyzing), partial [Gemmatimonadaceae bacterium]|nr:asparagine synthase (glutamine-hydrolyzing) [Gemmatimonadaceae bacterium]